MLACLIAFVLSAKLHIPLPPYQRIDTVKISQETYYLGAQTVSGDRLYAATAENRCVAVDLRNLKVLWGASATPKESVGCITAFGGVVYLTTTGYGEASSHLIALSGDRGKALWSLECQEKASVMAIGGGCIFLVTRPGVLSAVDLHSHQVHWEAPLTGDPREVKDCRSIQAVGSVVVVNYAGNTICLQMADGKPIWTEPHSIIAEGSLVVHDGVVWMPGEQGSVARQAVTGKILWRSPSVGPVQCGAAIGEKFIGMGSGQIVCLEGKTGKTLWSLPCRNDGFNRVSFVSGYLFAHSMMIDPNGNVVTTFDRDTDIGEPCWTNGTDLVSFDHNRLFRFRTGRKPLLPQGVKARKGEAERLMAHFGDLDSSERKRLVQLGDDAVGPVLQAFEQACKTDDGNSGHLCSILDQLCRPEDCPALIRALKEMPPSTSDMRQAYSTLIRVGNPSEVTQFFLYEIDKTKNVEDPLHWEYVAEDYVINSSDPKAVEFMLSQIGDPTAKYDAAAYFSLARTGGERGLQAVLRLQKQRAVLRPLPDRVLSGLLDAGQSAVETKVVAERTDSDGRTYGLFHCDILGDYHDLWLAEKLGSQWSRPILTGLQRQPGEDWSTKLVGNSEISKDSDGDGLTDLEEQRLGTNASLADTDGDGDPDDVDPWPNVGKRQTLTEEEQIFAAAFEARFHFSRREVAGVLVAPDNLRPFEMPGYGGPVIWRASSDPPLPLESRSHGTANIDFESEDTLESGDPPKELIKWNPQHTEATVVIGVSYGGEDGAGYKVVLRKFGGTWVAILKQRVWIF